MGNKASRTARRVHYVIKHAYFLTQTLVSSTNPSSLSNPFQLDGLFLETMKGPKIGALPHYIIGTYNWGICMPKAEGNPSQHAVMSNDYMGEMVWCQQRLSWTQVPLGATPVDRRGMDLHADP